MADPVLSREQKEAQLPEFIENSLMLLMVTRVKL